MPDSTNSFTPPRLSLRALLSLPSISALVLLSLISSSQTQAYVPAVPINDTSALNVSDSSQIGISWTAPYGVYGGRVSYQLQADIPTGGHSAGALVHFTEGMMGPNVSTTTPWIAYISCDVNETGASLEWDIFTLARDRGAVSALLYTATSQTCLLNQEYITEFEKPLDVFATRTVQVARVIDNQWTHTNDSFYYFNGTLLNDSAIDVNNSLAGNAPPYRTFLIGTLTARNSTGQATPTDIPNATSSAASSGRKSTPGSMIALYIITGIISVAFILMVIVGARRALRHPERYGRREATDEQGPQTTAGGVAQAILDTFPVIKFHRGGQGGSGSIKRLSSEGGTLDDIRLPTIHRTSQAHVNDGTIEAGNGSGAGLFKPEMLSRPTSSSMDDGMSAKYSVASPYASRRTSALDLNRSSGEMAHSLPSTTAASPRSVDPPHDMPPTRDAANDDPTDDQCPICLHDFETGDDLRVLPCEIRHVYHKTCIDPWLLEVSSSCPLCRKGEYRHCATRKLIPDFNNPNPAPESTTSTPAAEPDPPAHSGFARYLALMRRERRPRANTGGTMGTTDSVGRGRRREADQTGPGGY
ncbi:hypothetical protein DB88DRAFT_9476 [Papiliotrema laurentii]|uniref:RING-type domain-containing protein n=1 Tax=Papiliotrema laurentii TaxID=5418 RepID=A0AAD9FVT1_PAPLA|nr:hypothetical protein DB88DRAFT_9476 [Papiliotrema laurentii]